MKKDQNYGTCRQNKDEQILQRQSTGCNCRATWMNEWIYNWTWYAMMHIIDGVVTQTWDDLHSEMNVCLP